MSTVIVLLVLTLGGGPSEPKTFSSIFGEESSRKIILLFSLAFVKILKILISLKLTIVSHSISFMHI